MSMKIFVGNLPFSIGDKELKELFSSYGELNEVVIIIDKFSGRSKGFGFITFTEKSAAENAIKDMNGKEIQGRAIIVSEARQMDPDGPKRDKFRKRY